MKNFIHKTLFFAVCSTAVISCKPTLDLGPAPSAGSADFSRFVVIGDGTPGGYADASLNREAQLAAFPNILATQFKLIEGAGKGGEFIQPLVLPLTARGNTYTSFGFETGKAFTKMYLAEHTFCDGKTELYPRMTDSSITTLELLGLNSFKVEPPPVGGYYNNFAAQGTKMKYVNQPAPWASTSATYWNKIKSSANATMLGDAMAQKPTFVLVNLGGVDIFRFAKSGGNQDNGDDDMITTDTEFSLALYTVMDSLTANKTNSVKGVISNIIGVNSFPYFTYIKYDGLILSALEAVALTALHNNQFSFHAGRNAYVIRDVAAPTGKRQIKEGEYILIEIPQDSLRCYKLGGELPIRARWVLDASEIDKINTAIASCNSMTKAAAADYGFVYIDGHTNIKRVVEGTQFMGIKYTADMITGNQFTVDGLNITPFGQAMVAGNMIIEINKKYGSTIPLPDATKARGVMFR